MVFSQVILWICGLTMIGCFYMLYRNELVYRVGIKALDCDKHSIESLKTANRRYNALPSYNRMLWMLFTFKYASFVSKKGKTPKLLSLLGIKLKEI